MPYGTDPAEYFKQFTGEPEVPASIVAPEATPAQQPTQTPWYNNPGFWSKVGGIGSALVGAKTPLGQAAQYASQYHNAQQLDATTRKVMANAAAGTDPMTGIGTSETMGLMPDQITALNKEGVARQSALAEEERKGRVAESTIDYQKTIADQIKAKMEKEKTIEDNFNTTMDLVIGEKIKNKYVDAETAQILKGLGVEQGGKIYAELVAMKNKDPKITTYADQFDGKLFVLKDGALVKTYPIGKKPESSGLPDKSWHFNVADAEAFRRLGPQIQEAYIKSFGTLEQQQAKKEFQNLMSLVSDEQKGPQVINAILSRVGPDMYNTFIAHKNEIANSLAKTGSVPSFKQPIPDKTEIPVNKTTGSTEKDAEVYGKWLDENKEDLVSQLTSTKTPPGTYRDKKTKYHFYWDGKGGIELRSGRSK
jgi:hypothetical protein